MLAAPQIASIGFWDVLKHHFSEESEEVPSSVEDQRNPKICACPSRLTQNLPLCPAFLSMQACGTSTKERHKAASTSAKRIYVFSCKDDACSRVSHMSWRMPYSFLFLAVLTSSLNFSQKGKVTKWPVIGLLSTNILGEPVNNSNPTKNQKGVEFPEQKKTRVDQSSNE